MTASPPRYPALPLAWRIAILAIVVLQFLLARGAVWKNRFAWDSSILWSYATIPVLVLVALAVRRRLQLVSWFLHTLEIACAKFVITASILLAILIATRNEPMPVPPPRPPTPASRPKPVATPTPIDPVQTGTIVGRVVDGTGKPLAGAVVYVASGLEGYVFAPPSTPLQISNDGTGFTPSLAVAQTGQVIQARSTDGQLHTLLLSARAGNWVRNIPLLATGAANSLPSADMEGLFSLQCAVHGGHEGRAFLAIFRHPFFAIVGSDGRFDLRGVPAGNLTLAAFHPERAGTAVRVGLQPQGRAEVVIALDTVTN